MSVAPDVAVGTIFARGGSGSTTLVAAVTGSILIDRSTCCKCIGFADRQGLNYGTAVRIGNGNGLCACFQIGALRLRISGVAPGIGVRSGTAVGLDRCRAVVAAITGDVRLSRDRNSQYGGLVHNYASSSGAVAFVGQGDLVAAHRQVVDQRSRTRTRRRAIGPVVVKGRRHHSRIFGRVELNATGGVAVAIHVGCRAGYGEIATIRVTDLDAGGSGTAVAIYYGNSVGARRKTGTIFRSSTVAPGNARKRRDGIRNGKVDRSVHSSNRRDVGDCGADAYWVRFGDVDRHHGRSSAGRTTYGNCVGTCR